MLSWILVFGYLERRQKRLRYLGMWNFRHSAALWAVLLSLTGFCDAEICFLPDDESVLRPGYEYTYHFKSEAFGEAVGTTDDRGKLAIDCDVVISHSSECLYNLQLQNCHLTASGGPPGSETPWIDRHSFDELSKYPVSFSLINGEVTDVYTHQDDPIYFVNIKRGALSAFIFKLSYTTTQTQEIHRDIHGACPLTAIPIDSSGERVKTTKDMLYCAYPSRPDWQFSPWSLFWNMSFVQYVINSTMDCDYNINQGEKRIQVVFCRERHAIMLESSERTAVAVQTNIYYTMKFVKASLQEGISVYSDLTRRTSIAFEYERTPDGQSNPNDFLPVAKKMLSDLVQDSADEIRLFTIPQFTNFVAWLRTSGDLLPLVDTVKSCTFLSDSQCNSNLKELGISYLSDALVQCNSPACFEAISHLMKNGDLSPSYQNFIFYSWSNIHVSKPVIFKTLMNLCKETDLNLCWISLGSMIKRTYDKNSIYEPEELEHFKDIAEYLRDAIDESCSPTLKHFEPLLRFLKAVGNMGEHYLSLIPNGHDKLMDCIVKRDVPGYVRSSALEALKNMKPCQSDESCPRTYQRSLSILQEMSESTTVRVSAYDLIVDIQGDFDFEKQLLNILESDEDIQLKAYIAHSVKDLLSDSEMKINRKKFVTTLETLLYEKEISLEKLIHHPGAKSFTTTKKLFTDLPFMPDEMKGFGFKSIFAKVYQLYDAIPRHFHKESWWKTFSTLFPVYQTEICSEGLERIALILQKAFKDLNSEDSVSVEKFLKALPEIIKEFAQTSSQDQNFKFDEEVILNIRKLEEAFRNYSPQLKPFYVAFLDLFGSTLAHVTSGDLIQFGSKLPQMHKLLKSLHHGVTYNATRVIRVIEAYHQVPTMMGLPLNWTTNATLAVSMRSFLKLQLSEEHFEVHSKGFFQPSMALTFLNRMVLDFPTVTQIGVQANSSGYTSTQWKMNVDYSKEKKIISLEKPSKSQKFLELFRTNQLIKHDNYIDIADWDIDRFSSSWCTYDTMISVLGIQLCIDKSYPVVTQKLKPWALMSGWCKWQLSVDPAVRGVQLYHMEILKIPSPKFRGLALKFSTSGGKDDHELLFNAEMNDIRGEMKVEVTIPALPDFSISLLNNRNSEGSKLSSYKSISTLKIKKDYQYQLIYNDEERHEEHEDTLGDLNRPTRGKKSSVFTHEQLISLSTPFNIYRVNREDTKRGENVNTDIRVFYENLNQGRKWLQQILPPALWEGNSKAWFQVQINWKTPSNQGNSVTRHTLCYVRIPQSTIELIASSLEMPGREQINVNVTKTEVASRKMLGFANFTYDVWSSHSSGSNVKKIRVLNITIPRKSWSVHWQKISEDSKLQYELGLKRAVMTAKNSQRSDYVGWWNEDVKNDFSLQEHQVKAIVNTNSEFISSDELVKKYSSITQRDVEGLSHKLVKADIVLHYPFISGQESVTFDGYFIFSKGPTAFRFQKNFDMESSYNNLRLTSHSVYRTESDDVSLYHKSFFTHLPTQTKAFNTIDYKRVLTEEGCSEAYWEHDIRSRVFDSTSRATYKCHADNTELRTLRLQWTTNSSYWNMLNMKLDQLIDDINPEHKVESVNLTYSLALVNVAAEWVGKQKDHRKRVLHTCLVEECQNAELLIKALHNGEVFVNLNLLGDESKQISYRRSLSTDAKSLRLQLKYSDNEKEDLEDIQFSGEILKDDLHVWKAKINADTYYKIRSVIESFLESVTRHFARAAKDPQHPMNKILEPALKETLFDYWQGLKKQIRESATLSWSSIRETLQIMQAFYETPATILGNTITTAIGHSMKTYSTLKEKSVIIWAIDYFYLPYYFHKGFTNLDQGVKLLFHILQPEDGNRRFEFTTGRILRLTSFREWPSFPWDAFKSSLFPDNSENIHNNQVSAPGSKIAMIFGPLHVYTFDGHLFDSAEYSSDCLFLLAHDLRKSMFSVLSSEKSIHILFPEMTVTINDENEVFVNGSTTPSQLPIQAHNGKVIVRRGAAIEVWSPSLRVVCRSEDFLCVLELDSWHSGGTFGLLGNADGTSHNEFMLPDGKITSNVLEFIRSYEVSGKSDCKNLQFSSKQFSTDDSSQDCEEQFEKLCKQTSEVQDLFLRTCQSDLLEGHGPCYVATGYSALCHFKNLPSVTECNAKKQENKNIGHKLEVVLIVHEHSSLTVAEKKKSPYKGIERLLTAVDERFKSGGYSNVQFSLIGFGGKGMHRYPSLHTTERNIWVPLRTLANDILKTLEFNGSDTGDSLKAVKYALDVVGHDTFDSKVLIVLTAEDKQNKDKVTADLIQQQLENNGITLYTISSYPSIEKGKKVFGVRADGLIFPSPKKDGSSFMDYPKGELAKLTSGTRGSVFLSKFLIANSPSSYYGEIAEEIWAKVHKEANSCRECKTTRSGWWFVVNECSIVAC